MAGRANSPLAPFQSFLADEQPYFVFFVQFNYLGCILRTSHRSLIVARRMISVGVFEMSFAARILDLSSFSARQGFIVQGDQADDLAGTSVSSAGDVNGDGIDDMIVGAQGNDAGGSSAGAAYVIFGKIGATRLDIDLGNLPATDGFFIQGDSEYDFAGTSVASAGDVNGDGIDDLIVGAPWADNNTGVAYVIFGQLSATRTNIDLTNLTDSDGFVIQRAAGYSRTGFSVSSAQGNRVWDLT